MEIKYYMGKKTLWEKEKIAWYKQFLLFSQCFPHQYILTQ